MQSARAFELAWQYSLSGEFNEDANTKYREGIYYLQRAQNLVFPPQIDIEFSASDRIAAMNAEKQHFFNQVGKEME